MVLINESGSETLSLGAPAPDFQLPATDGETYRLASFTDSQALVIAFTCNHCPYAIANEDRFNELVDRFASRSIAFVAINANDAVGYPADSFEKMKERAADKQFAFPYLYDESQQVARAYGAVCTPHYFVLGPERTLVYEGRLDDNWQEPEQVTRRELSEALEALLAGEPIPEPQTNPMGCSIKWK
jgi:peroxiredoxin